MYYVARVHKFSLRTLKCTSVYFLDDYRWPVLNYFLLDLTALLFKKSTRDKTPKKAEKIKSSKSDTDY
jgi:hypothetical protein